MNEYLIITWTILLVVWTVLLIVIGLNVYTASESKMDSKEKITKAKTINEAIELCIIEAENNDQVMSYSLGWKAACVCIGKKLSLTRDEIISEIKEVSYSKEPPK